MANTIERPYPGLRPFREDESAYFFGRDSQIKEIVTRLKNSRFVAVIGGSGSGKSSLILAGAIPKLRSYAIQDAGDFWVPIITTPGTDLSSDDSPIKRLARHFCAALKPLDDAGEREVRLEHCVELLRRENGFNRLIEEYGRDLNDDNRDGVDLDLKGNLPLVENGVHPDKSDPRLAKQAYLVKINFLLLIDQFEELFHHTNQRVAAGEDDCQHLAQRIVDHFKQSQQPDESEQAVRLCVAITMRSEHLNDCPRYEDLPDAINAAVYLVKRLNQADIEEAIVKPAQAFLRRQISKAEQEARSAQQAPPDRSVWPRRINFDQEVILKLKDDSKKILKQRDHADQLPLLQHALYWIWVCAIERCKMEGNSTDTKSANLSFPDTITMADWRAAVMFKDEKSKDGHNGLTQCLELRCEWIYNREKKELRACWEDMFRNLAFKEPNTGAYTQARVEIHHFCQRHSGQQGSTDKLRMDLKKALAPWCEVEGNHGYLRWDSDDRNIKVTHESLIRRWNRFSKLIDEKDRQFQEYVQLLEACVLWINKGEKRKDVIEGATLRRVEDCGLPKTLADPDSKKEFDSLFERHRDRIRLNKGVDKALLFLDKSILERKRRKTKFLFLKVTPVFLALLTLWSSHQWVSGRLTEYKNALLEAISIDVNTLLELPPSGIVVQDLNEIQPALRNFLAMTIYSKQSKPKWPCKWCTQVGKHLGLYVSERETIARKELFSEARILTVLRSILLGNTWIPSDHESIGSIEIEKIDNKIDKQISIQGLSLSQDSSVEKRFFTSKNREPYGLLVVTDSQKNTQVFWAKCQKSVCITNLAQMVWAANLNSKLGFDAYQNYLVDYQENQVDQQKNGPEKITTIIPIVWPIGSQPLESNPLQTPQPIRIASRLLGEGIFKEPINALSTRNDKFSEDLKIGNHWFRFFNSSPKQLQLPKEILAPEGIPANSNTNEVSNCNKLTPVAQKNIIHQPQEIQSQMWSANNNAGDTFCLAIDNSSGEMKSFYGELYRIRANDKKFFPLIRGMLFGNKLPEEIRFDFDNGWIFSKLNGRWYEQPWSSTAWSQLAAKVYHPPQDSDSTRSRYTQFIEFLGDDDLDLNTLAAQTKKEINAKDGDDRKK